jgi:soluble lytic murein transglycosylase-like protein
MRNRRAVLILLALAGTGVAVAGLYGRGPATVPAQYRSLVLRAAASCPGLSPRLLAAQIEQESGWNPRAASRAGAQGIAQFMPRVWAAYAVDGNSDGVKDVWNPRDAIPSAAHFDCVLMKQIADVPGDKVRNMLAAYNAGPDKVHRYRGVPPFGETRAYVQLIVDRSRVLTIGPLS